MAPKPNFEKGTWILTHVLLLQGELDAIFGVTFNVIFGEIFSAICLLFN